MGLETPRRAAVAALTLWALLTAKAALAQNPQALFPPNVILPNNNSLPIGEVGGLEGNAYTARASDPTSLWFNPAGIAGANVSTVSASTGTFRILTVSPQKLEGNGGSIDQLPAAVGFVLKKPFNWEKWTFGFAVVRTARGPSSRTGSSSHSIRASTSRCLPIPRSIGRRSPSRWATEAAKTGASAEASS